MSIVIETEKLTKKYGDKSAVDHVDLHVHKGDIYGLIGKNGAGKTTLMRLLLGLAASNEGQIRLFDSDDLSAARHRIGSIIEEPGLYYGKTAFENMKTFSLLYEKVNDEEINALLKRVGLENTGKKKVKSFSLGMRQRLGIAIALLGHPEILILDEPINGLDPAGIKEIRDLILEMNASGVTFMISSHLLDELGKIATRYGIMANGALVEELSAEELNIRSRRHIEICVDHTEDAVRILAKNYPDLEIETFPENSSLHILTDIPDTSEISRLLVSGGIKLYSLHSQGATAEEYFLRSMEK